MPAYNPRDWYWNVGDHASSGVFASARGVYVSTSDATYQAWVAAGNRASAIPTEAELISMLAPYGITVQSAAGLAAYAQSKQATIAAGGISVNINGTDVEASTDSASLVLLQGAYAMAQANGAATFNWVQSNGVAVTLTAAQVIAIFNAVTAFLQSTFTTLAAVIAGIIADPATVTTQAQVDNPPVPIPAWPANS